MKRKLLSLSLILVLFSCTKDDVNDTIQPVISLTEGNEITVSLNSTYMEPGYSAKDNVDGDITSSVKSYGTVNMDLVGDYNMYYDVADKSGNKAATAIRKVKVRNDADFLLGSYNVSYNCQATYNGSLKTGTITTSTTVNNQFVLPILPYNCYGQISSDSSISISPMYSIVNCTGSGYASANQLFVDYVMSGSGGGANCSVTMTKQ
jgi:hypothetical protein